MNERSIVVFMLPVALFYTTAVLALSPQDFANGFDLQLEERSPIYRVTLNEGVYRSSAMSDLSDIAVFNAAGEPVPHLLRAPSRTTVRGTSHWTPLPVFPIARNREPGSSNITVQTDGTLIRIEGADSATAAAQVLDYIVDASRIQGRITEIELVPSEPGSGFVLPLAVETSADLNSWKTLVGKYHLAALEFAGHQLSQTRIPIPVGTSRYLRLRPLQTTPVLRLAAVSANVQAQASQFVSVSRLSVAATTAAESPSDIEFDLGGHFPISEAALNFAPNKLLQATLESRSRASGNWRRRYRGVLYALQRGDLLLRPNPIKLPGVRERYWRLTGIEPQPAAPFSIELAIAWRPDEIVFLAEGAAPYVLAVGRATVPVEPANYAAGLSKVIDSQRSARATLGVPVALGGAEKLSATVTIPWRRIILWAILVCGVAAVGFMVLRLLAQMNKGGH